MTRQEYSDIVEQIVREEERLLKEKAHTILKSEDKDRAFKLMAEAFMQSADISAQVTSRILKETGLVQFDE